MTIENDKPIVDGRDSAAGVQGTAPTRAEQRAGRILVVAFIALVAVTVGYFALGMPGMDHSTESSMDGMSMNDTPMENPMAADQTAIRLVDEASFEDAVAEPDTVVINVHIPYDGEIDGTDLFMAFDDIELGPLPADRDAPLAVYCKSGNMSALAVKRLVEFGYTDIVELDGGMQAWTASGRALRNQP